MVGAVGMGATKFISHGVIHGYAPNAAYIQLNPPKPLQFTQYNNEHRVKKHEKVEFPIPNPPRLALNLSH